MFRLQRLQSRAKIEACDRTSALVEEDLEVKGSVWKECEVLYVTTGLCSDQAKDTCRRLSRHVLSSGSS